jgi:transcriptional regulator with XRE-family HTH domain
LGEPVTRVGYRGVVREATDRYREYLTVSPQGGILVLPNRTREDKVAQSERAMTPEQVVGHRIAAARVDRGIRRQEELGARLAEYLGKKWTKQSVSETERGNRRLNPTELLAFATVLDYPISWFFLPPAGEPFSLPGRVVPVGELAEGPLRSAQEEGISAALFDEQMAILTELDRSRSEVARRVRGLLAITEIRTRGEVIKKEES